MGSDQLDELLAEVAAFQQPDERLGSAFEALRVTSYAQRAAWMRASADLLEADRAAFLAVLAAYTLEDLAQHPTPEALIPLGRGKPVSGR